MSKKEVAHDQSEDETTYDQSDKEVRVLTEREMKSMVIKGLKSVAKDLITHFQVFVIGASASFVISFVASKVAEKITK